MKKLTSVLSVAAAVVFAHQLTGAYAFVPSTRVAAMPATSDPLVNALEKGLQTTQSRNDACFLVELQRTDGYQPSFEENAACLFANASSQASVVKRVAHNSAPDGRLACFLMEMQRSDGWQPSPADSTACLSGGTVGPTQVATTSRVASSERARAGDRQFACFLNELHRSDGFQPSKEDETACALTQTGGPTHVVTTGR